jgi:hypothetical protein
MIFLMVSKAIIVNSLPAVLSHAVACSTSIKIGETQLEKQLPMK